MLFNYLPGILIENVTCLGYGFKYPWTSRALDVHELSHTRDIFNSKLNNKTEVYIIQLSNYPIILLQYHMDGPVRSKSPLMFFFYFSIDPWVSMVLYLIKKIKIKY